jgi:hypothetical protein
MSTIAVELAATSPDPSAIPLGEIEIAAMTLLYCRIHARPFSPGLS